MVEQFNTGHAITKVLHILAAAFRSSPVLVDVFLSVRTRVGYNREVIFYLDGMGLVTEMIFIMDFLDIKEVRISSRERKCPRFTRAVLSSEESCFGITLFCGFVAASAGVAALLKADRFS